MKSNLERAQDFAIDQWLSDHPEDMTYDEIIALLKQDTWNRKDSKWYETITAWYLIEDHSGEQIANFIEDTCADVQRLLG